MSGRQFTVTRVSDGVAFGSGTISGQDGGAAMLARVDEVLHSNPDILVPIDHDDSGERLDDDGCGDGRAVIKTFTKDREFKRSLNRAKVFGGATAMTAAIIIGTGNSHHATLDRVFDVAIEELDENNFNYGAHTDDHASSNKCGCGAIDRAPEAVLAVVKYEAVIRSVLEHLALDTAELDEVFANYRDYVTTAMPQLEDFSGRKIMDAIIAKAKVVKQLGGDHREKRIVLNMVPGYTVNQALIRTVSDNQAQVFAVDVPRLEDIAKTISGTDAKLCAQAFLSELAYTLGIAAVLTKGDLPVDVVQA